MMLKSYQLILEVSKFIRIHVGSLGICSFPKGFYVYTGSAKKNMDTRIKRHLKKHKKKHWHIDYLTSHPDIRITEVKRSETDECVLNQQTDGQILIAHFGATDCHKACGSHLKYIGLNL